MIKLEKFNHAFYGTNRSPKKFQCHKSVHVLCSGEGLNLYIWIYALFSTVLAAPDRPFC